MFLLPVSRMPVTFRAPDGRDELLLAEASPESLWLRVEAVRRLAAPAMDGAGWNGLPYADVDAALLGLRRQLYGDRLDAEIECRSCGAWGDVVLSISAYLEANRPGQVRDAHQTGDGWWNGSGLRFRIPTTEDVLDELARAGTSAAAAAALERKCTPQGGRRVNSLLNRIAPPLSGLIQGQCPQCGLAVKGWFDAGGFVLAELKRRARMLFDHVHLLATAYGWPEDAILALPSTRRSYYAARIQEGLRA